MGKIISDNRLTVLAKLLFMPMAFYILIQWDKISTWQSMIGWFVFFFLVQIECLSVDKSLATYSLPLYLFDLLSLSMYVLGLGTLTKTNPSPIIGYDPMFWICLSIIYFGYAGWNFLMSSRATDPQTKKSLKFLGWIMILVCIIILFCGLFLLSIVSQPTLAPNNYILYIIQLIPLCIIIGTVVYWFMDFDSLLGNKA